MTVHGSLRCVDAQARSARLCTMSARRSIRGVCALAVAALLGATAPAALAHDTEHAQADRAKHAGATATTPATTSERESASELRASWRVRFEPRGGKAQEQTWHLHRGADRSVWSKGSVDEVWRRGASGISLERVMHAQRHVIDYTAGELRTLGVERDWDDLGTLFSERDLAALKPAGPRARDGRQRLRGTVAGEQVELLWDARARLPAALVQTNARGRVRFERIDVVVGADAARAWRGEASAADYARIDAADFGDMEGDPVVRIAMAFDQRLGWRRAHGH